MACFVADPELVERLIADRQARGVDQHDEVWEGVYFMAPMAGNEHQSFAARLVHVLCQVIDDRGLGRVFGGVNLAPVGIEDWKSDFRCPDVAVFLNATGAEDCDSHWRGAADFLIEIISPDDRTREKLSFYAQLGVREVLVVDRAPWSLDLYRLDASALACVTRLTPGDGQAATSQIVPLTFQLVAAEPRPKILIAHHDSRQRWEI